MASTVEAASNPLILRQNREQIYAKQVHHVSFVSRALALKVLQRGRNGQVYSVPPQSMRVSNFSLFVKENFAGQDELPFSSRPWPSQKNNISAYKKLKEYSQTPYGAMTIQLVLHNNKLGNNRFSIEYKRESEETNQAAQAGYNFILLPDGFPLLKTFKTSGQLIDPLAIIHHEFGHTRFYTQRPASATITLQHERNAVIYNENPVRIFNGFEPRYTYSDGSQTINIITGKIENGLKTFSKYDPGMLVMIGSKDAYKLC